MKSIIKIALMAIMSMGMLYGAEKYEDKKLVITLASGELMASGLGTALALGAVQAGAEVTVIIGANSLKYVTKNGFSPKFPSKKKTIKKLLKLMVNHGAEILVCGMCAKTNGLKSKDFIKGAVISPPTPILNAMLDKDAKTFEY